MFMQVSKPRRPYVCNQRYKRNNCSTATFAATVKHPDDTERNPNQRKFLCPHSQLIILVGQETVLDFFTSCPK